MTTNPGQPVTDRTELPEQPDGINPEHIRSLPAVENAIRRIHNYVTAAGDGLYEVYEDQPLYARDLEALCRAAERSLRPPTPPEPDTAARCLPDAQTITHSILEAVHDYARRYGVTQPGGNDYDAAIRSGAAAEAILAITLGRTEAQVAHDTLDWATGFVVEGNADPLAAAYQDGDVEPWEVLGELQKRLTPDNPPRTTVADINDQLAQAQAAITRVEQLIGKWSYRGAIPPPTDEWGDYEDSGMEDRLVRHDCAQELRTTLRPGE